MWWLVEDEEDRVPPLTSTRKTYQKFFAYVQEDDEPSGRFGRGQPMPSVHTGWKPKPNQWRLLGGGKPKKKVGPKAQESQNGKFFFNIMTKIAVFFSCVTSEKLRKRFSELLKKTGPGFFFLVFTSSPTIYS